MGFVFDQIAAEKQEAWYGTETGRAGLRLQRDLIMRLAAPRPGERLLDVGCGSGRHLQMFKREGLLVTGLDPSRNMLSLARQRLGDQVDLHLGRAEDLPFEDNEFDIVTLVTSLEFCDDPEAAVAEAVRVAGSRIFIGVLNSYSLTALGRRIRGVFRHSVYNQAKFFSLLELIWMLRGQAGPAKIKWGSVHLLPPQLIRRMAPLESRPLLQRTPFGAFLGVTADLAYTLRADGLPVKHGLKLPAKHATAPPVFGRARRRGEGPSLPC